MQDLYTTLSPAECLDRAESYMLAKPGATEISERTEPGLDSQVSFRYRPPFTNGEIALVLVASLFTFGVSLLYVAFRIYFKQEVRLMVRPAEGEDGRARVLIDGKTEGLVQELRAWAEKELAGH